MAWFSLSLIGGIGLAYFFYQPVFLGWQWFFVAAALLAIAFIKRTAAFVLLAIAAGLLLGFWRGGNVVGSTFDYQKFVGQSVVLRGRIAADVTHKNGEAGLKLNHVQIGQMKLGGEVWAGTTSQLDLKRGDEVRLTGKLKPGFGNFVASLNYARLTSARRSANLSLKLRDNFDNGLQRAVPEPEAQLGIGYLVGKRNNLPATLTKQLQLVGLIHLVIAGGYNVTILVRFLRRGFGRISKYLAVLLPAALLIGLTFMTGFSAPMARTTIITGLSLAAWYYGRRLHPLVLLPLAAAITAIINPTFVDGNIGWLMTFVAYGGLILLAPLLKQIFWKHKSHGLIKQIFADTLSVQVVTMPLLAIAFQQYSIYGLPANLLVLPLMPLTMLAIAIAGLGGMFLPAGIAQIIGWPAARLLGYTDHITTTLATAPGANYAASLKLPLVILTYAVIIAVIYLLHRQTKFNYAQENVVE
ncbi:MAG: ComEC/Rec2 family competence protein [Candidatus Saccharimonadales bacterium]